MSAAHAEAARVLGAFLAGRGGLKSLAFAPKVQRKKMVFLLVAETTKYLPAIKEAMGMTKALRVPERMLPLAYIMLYDLLFGKRKKMQGGGAVKKLLQPHAPALKAAVARIMVARGVSSQKELLDEAVRVQEKIPRYARVNTLVCAVDEAVARLEKDGFAVRRDPHVRNLLVMPPRTDLHDHELVLSSGLILQDKSSCFPAEALVPDGLERVPRRCVDACAAPGNKTSHLAMLLAEAHGGDRGGPRGSAHVKRAGEAGVGVQAFEIEQRRCKLLQRRMEEAGAAPLVAVRHQSFFDAPLDDVECVLLDPSCSATDQIHFGSVMKARQAEADPAAETRRVEALAAFQVKALKHAMSGRGVRRISYSTCSSRREEDEHVVRDALAEHKDWTLARIMPTWTRRGHTDVEGLGELGARCVRTLPAEDLTGGFFLAVFERLEGEAAAAAMAAAAATPAPTPAVGTKRPRDDDGDADEDEDSDDGGAATPKPKSAAAVAKRKRKRKNQKKRKRERAQKEAAASK